MSSSAHATDFRASPMSLASFLVMTVTESFGTVEVYPRQGSIRLPTSPVVFVRLHTLPSLRNDRPSRRLNSARRGSRESTSIASRRRRRHQLDRIEVNERL